MRNYQGLYKPKEKTNLICKYCSKEFLGTSNKKYCSRECYYANNLKRQNENYTPQSLWKPKEINCKMCGKLFIQKTYNQKFCGKKCLNESGKIEYENASLGIIEAGKEENKVLSYFKLRFEIFKRDRFICQYCGRNPQEDKCILEIDHIIPRSKDGKLIPSNLITSCNECNMGKGDVLLQEKKLNELEEQNEKTN